MFVGREASSRKKRGRQPDRVSFGVLWMCARTLRRSNDIFVYVCVLC